MTKEEVLDLLESLRLSEKESQAEKEELQDDSTIEINDPSKYNENEPFLLKDGNGETIISKTAKGINEGQLNPYEINLMEVTLYNTIFIKQLLDTIHSDKIMDVAQAIEDEEMFHVNDEGRYISIYSESYGQGQKSSICFRGEIDWECQRLLATNIAENILSKLAKAEEYKKKHKPQQVTSSYALSGCSLNPDGKSAIEDLSKVNTKLKQKISELEKK